MGATIEYVSKYINARYMVLSVLIESLLEAIFLGYI